MLQILDRYYLKSFIAFFIGALVFFTGISMIAKIMETLDSMLKFDGDSAYVYMFYIYNIPNFVMIVLPPSLMFAVTFSIATLSRHNELAVIMSAGRSAKRVLMPVYIIAGILTVFLFFFNEYVVYPSNYKAYTTLNHIWGKESTYRLSHRHNFAVRAGNRYFHIGSFAPVQKEIKGLHMVETHEKSTSIKQIIEAEKAVISPGQWQLTNATITRFDEKGDFIARNFSESTEAAIAEGTDYFLKPTKKFEESNIHDLARYVEHKKKRGEPYLQYLTEYYWHWGYPLVCVFVAVIGGMVGSYLKKGAMSSSLSLSLVISVVYFVVMFFGKSLGNTGALPPFIAAWLGNLLFIFLTGYVFYKLNR